ncbi:MAG: hypothetical protein LBS26_01105, partial [Campylobacteraceae bacterium]|nr:hypothetical protein [Campylobacteraceae bacterium]
MFGLCLNLVSKFTNLSPNVFNSAVQKYCKRAVTAVFAFLALGAYANAVQAVNCDYVYGIINDGTSSRVYRYNNISSGTTNTSTDIIFSGSPISTLAIGFAPDGSGGVTDEIRIYRWKYHTWTTKDNASSDRPSYFISNSTNPRANIFYSNTSITNQESAGGEVNQMTGEIYLSSKWDDKIYPGVPGDFGISVINPQTGTARTVKFTPADGETLSLGQAISDMIIDADGNSFVIAESGSDLYITRLNMTTGKYNTVKKITGTKPSIHAGGLALLDGMIYVLDGGQVFKIDPVTGVSTQVGIGQNFTDLGSCQLVPLIRGEVFNDANGNGQIDAGESGIGGITVQLYASDGVTVLGEQTTTGTGTYDFIINNINNADFYIRVKNPTINGKHAAQTYASGGTFVRLGTNTVTNYCTDFTNNDIPGTTNRTCYGARANGIDSTNNGTIGVANYYSKINVNTDKAVTKINFAFTTAYDESDAPSAAYYSKVERNIGIKDGGNPIVYLGSGASEDTTSKADANANGDDFDDGVFVMINGIETPLQNAVLLRNKTYTIKAYANGTRANETCISPFIGQFGFNSPFDILYYINGSINPTGCFDATSAAAGLNYTVSTLNSITISTLFRTIITHKPVGAAFTSINSDGSVNSSESAPWVLNGEVEDYKFLIAQGQVRLNVRSINDVGNFTFDMDNIEVSPPSNTTRTIQTVTSNVSAAQPYDGIVHAIDIADTDIIIHNTSTPSQFELITSETKCVDFSYSPSNNLSITFNAGSITIPGSEVKADSDIVCDIVYDVLPTIEFSANITNRIHANDNFNITIKDANNSNATIASAQTSSAANASTGIIQVVSGNEYLFDEIMASGSVNTFGHYAKDINCTNNGTAITTNGSIPFSITPVWNDKIKCEITNSALNANLTSSQITVEPQTQEAGNSSTITVTLKDSLGSIINAGGDNVTIFI